MRLAIGAGRARLIRQLLAETLLLFVLGGGAGLLLARAMTSAVVARLLPEFPVPVNLALPLDGRVVLFTIGISLLAALLSGLAPALQGSKADVVTALKAETQGPADRLRLRNAFVIAQVAFSIVLVVLAGLLGRALRQVSVTDRGFDPRGVELASVDLSLAGYTETTGPAFARALLDRVRDLPGVESAALADRTPLPGVMSVMLGDGLSVPGVTPPNGQPLFMTSWTIVEPGYFSTLRIPFVAGRDFSAGDRAGEPSVIIVPASTARRLWPGQNAVGKSVIWQSGQRKGPGAPLPPPVSLLVVGVVKNLKSDGPRGDPSTLAAYVPLQQRYRPRLTIMARATDGRRLTADIHGLVQSMDPNLPDPFVAHTRRRDHRSRGDAVARGRIGVRKRRDREPAARGDRHLRGHGVRGRPADARNRHPPRARRPARRDPRHDPAPGNGARGRRRRRSAWCSPRWRAAP